MSEPSMDDLKDLLTEARYFVEDIRSQPEDFAARAELLVRIDEAIPPPPNELIEACEKHASCFQPKDHEGACDGSITF